MSIAAAFAADKNAPFRPAPAGSLPHHQTNGQVTIGAEAYTSSDKVKAAFGQLDPNQHGILPILLVIQNDTNKSIRLDGVQVRYIAPSGGKVEPTPPGEVKYVRGPDRPKVITGPGGMAKVLGKKNPLNSWEIEGRAFTAVMLPPGQTASGFFYFQTASPHGGAVFVNGLVEAGAGGQELLYFEVSLD